MSESWVWRELGEIATLKIGRTPPRKEALYWSTEPNLPFCTIKDMTGKWILPNREGITQLAEQEGKARRVPAGSLLMSFKLTIGRLGFASVDLFPNEAIVEISPISSKDVSKDFLYFALASLDLTEDSSRAAKGMTLNLKSLRALQIPIPPPLEQGRIVDLIKSIDEYIAALEQQFKTGQTVRRALLTELLMAPDMQEEWQQLPISEVAELNPKDDPLPEDAPFVPMDAVNVDKRWIQYTEPRGERGGIRAKAGDILFARLGVCLTNGKTAQVQSSIERCGGSTEFIVLRAGDLLDPGFLYLWANHAWVRAKAESLMSGGSHSRIKEKDLGSIPIYLPPLAEQQRIVTILESLETYINAQDATTEAARTARQALLTDLLTPPPPERRGWRQVAIGDCCHIQQGRTLALKDVKGGDHPVYGANGIVGYHTEGNIEVPTVALGCRGSCGTVRIAPPDSWLGNNVMGLVPKADDLSIEFVSLLLETADLRGTGVISGQVQEQITRESLAPLLVEIPSPEEQQHIVDIIDGVDEMLQATQTTITHTRTTRQAVLTDLLSGKHEIPDSYDNLLEA